MAGIDSLSDDELIALSRPKTKFKDTGVEKGFANVTPGLRSIAETIPATVTSTFRSPSQNVAVGGVPNSYHMQGEALDYRKGELRDEDRKRLGDSGYQIIAESDHDHVEPIKGFKKPQGLQGLSDEELRQLAGGQQDVNRGIIKDSSFLDKAGAVMSGISRANPTTRMAESITEGLGIPNQLEKFEQAAPNWEKGGRIAGEVVSSLPQMAGGMAAMKGLLGASKGAQLGAGAITNLGIGQLNRGPQVGSVQDYLIDAGTGVGGEALGMGLQAAGKGLSKLPGRLMNSALGTSAKSVEKAIERGGKSLGDELVERGIWGTQKGLAKQAEEGVAKYGSQLDEALKGGGKINRGLVADELSTLKHEMERLPLNEGDVKTVDKLMRDFWGSGKYKNLTAESANTLKRQLDKELGNKAFLAETLPGKKDALMGMRRGLKKAIEKSVPQAKDINKELGVYHQLDELVGAQAAKDTAAKGISLPRLGSGMTGTIVGSLLGGGVGGAAGLAASEALRSTLGKTGGAQLIKYLSEILKSYGSQAGRTIGSAAARYNQGESR